MEESKKPQMHEIKVWFDEKKSLSEIDEIFVEPEAEKSQFNVLDLYQPDFCDINEIIKPSVNSIEFEEGMDNDSNVEKVSLDADQPDCMAEAEELAVETAYALFENRKYSAKDKMVKDEASAMRVERSEWKNEDRPKLSVFSAAEVLIDCAKMICYGNRVYYFNGIYYEEVDERKIVTIACQHLDPRLLNSLSSMKFLKDTLELIRCTEYIDTDGQLDENGDGRYVTFQNGTVDILTGELYSHSQKFLTFYALDAKYIPDDDLETPAWDTFLRTSVGSVAMQLVMEVLGYIISPFLSAKRFFVLGHASNSGKSLFANFLRKVIGAKNISDVALEEMGENFGLAPIVGKVLNLGMDLEDEPLSKKTIAQLKKLTGMDVSTINEKYEKRFSYINKAKFLFATNHPLKFKKRDEAFIERMVFVPFMTSIPKSKRDRKLMEKILAEKDAILTKAILAARDLYYHDFVFTGEDEFRELGIGRGSATVETVEWFYDECCEQDISNDEITFTEDLYSSFKQFCDENHLEPISECRFSKELSAASGVQKRRGNKMIDGKRVSQPWGFPGIKIKQNC